MFENTRYIFSANYDATFLLDKPYRMRANVEIIRDPDGQYWGMGRKRLFEALTVPARGNSPPQTFTRIKPYEEALEIPFDSGGVLYTDAKYNRIFLESQLYNVAFERLLAESRVRVFLGYEIDLTRFRSYAGQKVQVKSPEGQVVEAIHRSTQLEKDRQAGIWDALHVTGYEESRRWWISSILAWAVMYDTRDLEPDPTRGVFLEYSHELQAPWLGGDFRMNKIRVQSVGFYTPVRWGRWGRLTLAGLAAFGYIWGKRLN
ncbi:MAG: outer membrane protein assembly factor [Bacteroidia bacterium]|nr:outer membrane protein assembly factor [Bacteroidia bacterium]